MTSCSAFASARVITSELQSNTGLLLPCPSVGVSEPGRVMMWFASPVLKKCKCSPLH